MLVDVQDATLIKECSHNWVSTSTGSYPCEFRVCGRTVRMQRG